MKNIAVMLTVLLCFMLISCDEFIKYLTTDSFPKLGNGYRVVAGNCGDGVILDSMNVYMVSGHILKYGYDSTYIIAEQKPRDSLPDIYSRYDERREAFNKFTMRKYWIIDKKQKPEWDANTCKNTQVYGPFTKEEYMQKRQELGVPNSLQFQWRLVPHFLGGWIEEKIEKDYQHHW